jgi:hypothetical protein
MGHHSLKITFNEMTRVSMREDDPSVPLAEDFCVTIKQLMEMPVGEVARVICLVKVCLLLCRMGRSDSSHRRLGNS